MSFPIASSFPAKTIDLGAVAIAWTVELTDVVVLCDYLKTAPQKSLAEIGVLCDYMAKDALKPLTDLGKATEYTRIAGVLTITDVLKGLDYIRKTPLKSLADTGKILDLIKKTIQKIFRETGKSVEAFSKTTIFYRDLTDCGILLDYLAKDIPRTFTDVWKIADWSKLSPAKILAEAVKTLDWLTKTAIFHKDLHDVGKVLDILAKDIPRTLIDKFIGEYESLALFGKAIRDTIGSVDYMSKSTSKQLADTGKLLDFLGKTPLKTMLDAGVVKDVFSRAVSWTRTFEYETIPTGWLEKTVGYYRSLADAVKTLDWISKTVFFIRTFTDYGILSDYLAKTVLKSILDQSVGEFTYSKGIRKLMRDDYTSLDYISRHISKPLVDASKTLDRLEKKILKSILDTGLAKDLFSRTVSWTRTFEYETIPTGWITRTVHYYRDLTDYGKLLDWRGAFDILRNFKEFVIIRDQSIRAISVILTDTFLSEYWTARGVAPAVRDTSKVADILTKIAYKLYGYDVRRVYTFPRVWADTILSLDHNTKVEVCKALLEAVKRLKDKLES